MKNSTCNIRYVKKGLAKEFHDLKVKFRRLLTWRNMLNTLAVIAATVAALYCLLAFSLWVGVQVVNDKKPLIDTSTVSYFINPFDPMDKATQLASDMGMFVFPTAGIVLVFGWLVWMILTDMCVLGQKMEANEEGIYPNGQTTVFQSFNLPK